MGILKSVVLIDFTNLPGAKSRILLFFSKLFGERLKTNPDTQINRCRSLSSNWRRPMNRLDQPSAALRLTASSA